MVNRKERLGLFVFGLGDWIVVSSIHPTNGMIFAAGAIQAGIGGLCMGTALLPGRTARFS